MLRRSALATIIAAAISLSGCASYSGIHTEAKQQPQSELEGGKDLAATLTKIDWPEATWWTSFKDEQLNTLIQTALNDSPTLKSAAARVRQAQALAESARQATLPQASGGVSSERELFTGDGLVAAPAAGNWLYSNSAVVKASYDIDLWGRDESELAAAIGSYHASQAETRSAQLTLESSIVRSYLKLAQAFVSRDIVRETLQQQRDVMSIAERAYKAGVGTRLDLTDAQTPIPQSEASEKALDEQIALLQQQLAVLSGHGPGAGDHLTRPVLSDALYTDEAQKTLVLGVPDQLPANLIGRRPDVIAQRWKVEAMAHSVDAVQASFYPNINLSAFAGFESIDFTHWFSAVSAVRGATGAISLPFFQTGVLRAKLGSSAAQYDQAVESYNGTLLTALQNVTAQIVTMRSTLSQQQDLKRGLELATRSFDLSERAFKAGITTYITTSHAQVSLLQARQRLALNRANYLDAWVQLMQALGGGLGDDLAVPESIQPRIAPQPDKAAIEEASSAATVPAPR